MAEPAAGAETLVFGRDTIRARRVTGPDPEQHRQVRATKNAGEMAALRHPATAHRWARRGLLPDVCDSAGWLQRSLAGHISAATGRPGVASTYDADREDTCVTIRTAAGRRLGAMHAELAAPCGDAGVVPECSEGGDAGTGVPVAGSTRLRRARLPDRPRTARWLPVQLAGRRRPRAALAQALVCRPPRLLVAGEPASALVAAVPQPVPS